MTTLTAPSREDMLFDAWLYAAGLTDNARRKLTDADVRQQPNNGAQWDRLPLLRLANWYVEVSYVARSKLQKLSVYCGVSWQREAQSETARALKAVMVQQCAEAVQMAVRAVSVVLSRHPQLEVHSGASLHLHNIDDGPWMAGPGTHVDVPPTETCGVCGVEIHFSNEHWRDDDMRYEVLKDVAGRYGKRKALDHVHAPAGMAVAL
jgi:hypothetical protein